MRIFPLVGARAFEGNIGSILCLLSVGSDYRELLLKRVLCVFLFVFLKRGWSVSISPKLFLEIQFLFFSNRDDSGAISEPQLSSST